MFAKIAYTWEVMGSSWRVLKQDRELLLFAVLSMLACLIVMASFAVPMYRTENWQPPGEGASTEQQVMYYATLFLFYFCNYFVITFFNCAIVACAVTRLSGGDPTFGEGMRAAVARLPQIVGWALISATVGLMLRIIEDRSEKVGQFVAGLLGMAWTMVSFLVVPVLVVERKGAFESLKKSTALLKRTWGEQIVGGFSFGGIGFLLCLPAGLLIVLGVLSGSIAVTVVCVGVGVFYLICVSLIMSTLRTIFQAAVYFYAEHGDAPAEFDAGLLAGAMQRK